ncbi:cation diffusion facilitator family transporter [Agaribacterium sp. ZY112]|uniref:cation diffusion facilitator family transporter n=1 Tax=Agaribacterium sp. ZY112 TaxID=3233574 RepID=UPI003523B7F3
MHSHNHHHENASSKRIAWAFFLNVSFTIIEFIGGWLTNSTAIMADAVHDLGDSLSIGLAWLLGRLSEKEATTKFSYGYRRFSLLGALINGVVLVIGSVWVLTEAIPKLFNPEMPVVEGMLGLAIMGVMVNGYAALKLSAGKTLNEKILNWHLLEDVLGWVAVLIVSIILMFVEWPVLDPILSIVFTLFILANVVRNLWTTIKLFLQAAPSTESYRGIRSSLLRFNEISEIHHLHLWSLDGEHHVMTVHLVLNKFVLPEAQLKLKKDIANSLEAYGLQHTTIEFEFPNEACRDQNHDENN